jgi:cytochrome P450
MPEAKAAPIPLHKGPGESGTESNSPQLIEDPVSYFTSGYRRHGPVFRTRYRDRDWVTIAGIEANDFFWQNPADWSYEQAGPGFRDQFGPTYVTQLDGAPHLRKRRLLKPAFSAEAVGRYVPAISREAERFLGARADWSDDANEWIPALLLSFNAATLLQTSLSVAQMRDAIKLEGELIYGVGVSASPAIYFGRPGYAELKKRVFDEVDRELTARSNGKRAPDNLQTLLDQETGSLEPLSPEELRNDAYMLLVAGIHNTAKLLTRILERISQDPEWMAELRAELAGYEHESFIRGLGSFPKLRATILEGERLHPGATFLKRRPVRDLSFSGHTIGAGAYVMQAHTLPHFLPEYYSVPMGFNPRRWIEGELPQRKALADFGGGSHICIGMNLTRVQVPIVLAEILRQYDWQLGYTPSFGLTVDLGLGMRESHERIALSRKNDGIGGSGTPWKTRNPPPSGSL